MSRRLSLTILALLALVLTGCEKEQPAAPVTVAEPPPRRETRVVVPEAVQGQWKAVKIAILDKQENREEIYTIDLGEEFTLPSANLSIEVKNFLPAFIMEGTVLTSVSNEPKNPAVQITVREQGREIFKGWLFSLYPGTHAFQHPRYSFTLVDYLPAKKG